MRLSELKQIHRIYFPDKKYVTPKDIMDSEVEILMEMIEGGYRGEPYLQLLDNIRKSMIRNKIDKLYLLNP